MPSLEERIKSGEIQVVERGPDPVVDEGVRTCNGEYRILSDGRRQWRQLHRDGSPSYHWPWKESKE
jgi:predicted lipoprotein with Yx(FWY)xxD motif